jgi:proline racemase
MSGSNAMCVTTVLLETGILPIREPQTRVALDTPAGLVIATATCKDGRCERVTLDLVPSFVEHLGQPLEIEGVGTLRVDIAYGGDWFCLVDAAACGLEVAPGEAREMVALGRRIKRAARQQIRVRNPEIPDLREIGFVMFCARAGTGAALRCAAQRQRHPPGPPRPLALRHRDGGAARGHARAGRDPGRRDGRDALGDRQQVRGPDRRHHLGR